ncbi:glycoside hydrolase [Tothia fuscella]|uniref:Glycoside hydrolase n=1 Tax=Tothia fuscella TaxID=1048955 RepID=A0A9P4P0A2_9PEZI|nr:glycoside hydrolase [Tothia fuscella]
MTLPRLILYQQTHIANNVTPVSLLPLLEYNTGVTHIYIAAIHLNDQPGHITLNDHPLDHERHDQMWREVKELQDNGVAVMGMLGGAAAGSYMKLQTNFEAFYTPLCKLFKHYKLQGIDLDIEEVCSLDLTRKLIMRFKKDFGPSFIVTLAPVAGAMQPYTQLIKSFTRRLIHGDYSGTTDLIRAFIKPEILKSKLNLSGFNHFALEASEAGKLVDWYNVQFYCNHGDASNAMGIHNMVSAGWDPKKLVLGVVVAPDAGAGYVPNNVLIGNTIADLKRTYGNTGFGGIMGWEYALANRNTGRPWEWVREMGEALGRVSGSREKSEKCESCVPVVLGNADITVPVVPLEDVGQQSLPERAKEGEGSAGESTVNDADAQKLVEMGFERPEAIAALEAMDGDVAAAAGLLFGDD